MKTDGGRAFPLGSGDMRDPMGMSLRDYFAGQALMGLMASWAGAEGRFPKPEQFAADAYAQSDAMLAERAKEE